LLIGCAGTGDDDEALSVSQAPLHGLVTYGADCPSGLKIFLDQIMAHGRAATATPAFRQCMAAAIHHTALTVPVYGQSVANYRQCLGDPAHGRPPAEQLAAVLMITRSQNDLHMGCTGGGGNASAVLGPYDHSDPEAFAWGSWLTGVYNQLSMPVCGTPGAPPTGCRAAPYPWPYSQAAGLVWHEASHTHGYTHGDNAQAGALVACGYASDPTWDFQTNTMPYLIEYCTHAVIDQSGATCGGDLTTGCGPGELRMIDSFSGTTCSCVRDPHANLAAGKPATQSSTAFGGAASRAVDGNLDGDWNNGSVTHTGNDAEAWWQVDLGAVRDIGKVVIHNRTDCCTTRLADFDILISNDGVTWHTTASFGGSAPARAVFSIESAGRFVKVRLRGTDYLNLAEVQVFEPQNLALSRPATQSSTYAGDAAQATDGNTDGNAHNGSVTHTGFDAQAWWQVDLGAVKDIGRVVLHNRTDCCGSRLADFDIQTSLDGITWQTQAGRTGPAPDTSWYNIHVAARFVRVRLRGTNYLSLAEVRIFPARDLASSRTATQSSTVTGGEAWRAVDGNIHGIWSNGSVTHTGFDAQAWWQVDLGAVTDINRVVLYNRTDCCSSRLADFDVQISNTGSSWTTAAGFTGQAPARTALAVAAAARFVRVRLRGTNNLSLAEVQVIAP
jgi:hypothetical protein